MVNPIQDQRDLLTGKSYVVLDKKVLIATGEDRLSWLNDIFSQKIIDLVPGKSHEALWLDAQGHIQRDIHLIDDGEKTYLISFSNGFEDFVSSLTRMIFRAKVKLEVMPGLLVLGTFNQRVTCSTCQGKGTIPESNCKSCQGTGVKRQKKSIKIEIPKGIAKGIVTGKQIGRASCRERA